MAALDETRVPTPDLSGPTEQAKDKVRARAILNSARGGKSQGSEGYNVKIPTTPTLGEVNEARGILGKDILSTEQLLKMYKNIQQPKSKASGGLVGGQTKLDKNKDGKISGVDFDIMKRMKRMNKGGYVKNYAYGGRVAKSSAEKS